MHMTSSLSAILNVVPSLQPKLYFNLAHGFGKSKLQRMHIWCHCIEKEPSLFVYLQVTMEGHFYYWRRMLIEGSL